MFPTAYKLRDKVKYTHDGEIKVGTVAHVGAISLSVLNDFTGIWHSMNYADVICKVEYEYESDDEAKLAVDTYNGIPDYRDAYIHVVKFNKANLAQVMIDIALETGNEEMFKQYSQGVTT